MLTKATKMGNGRSAIVDQIKRFVKANVENDFSREDIAAHVYMNSDYVSRLFKKEMGQSLLEYITKEKMYRAKQLLVQSNHKVCEVGESIGYNNIPYFTKLFKKIVGVSPQEYRKKFKNIS